MAKATKSATELIAGGGSPIGQTQGRALVGFRDPPASYAERRRSATAVPETSRDRAHVNPGGETQLSMGPSVPRPDPRSPYEHLAVALRDQITNGAIAVGQQLPTGKELSKRSSASRLRQPSGLSSYCRGGDSFGSAARPPCNRGFTPR